MTEKEVIEKLEHYKEAILKVKSENRELKKENEDLKNKIEDLEKSKSEAVQETQAKAETDKEAFLQEISRVIEEASEALSE